MFGMMYYVYEYVDPMTNLPFYIGKGTANRLHVHLKETLQNTGNKRKHKYIVQLQTQGFEPIVRKVQENLTESEAYDLEVELIKKWGRKGLDEGGILTNYCPDNRPPKHFGKDHHLFGKGIPRTPEQELKRRKSLSAAKKGKPSRLKGRVRSEKIGQMASITHRGKHISEETKQKIRDTTSGQKNHSYGKIWITNGSQTIKTTGDIPNGWRRGRTLQGE